MSQNAPSTDLRVRRTRKLLREALVVLIEERGFDTLKVSDIADRAMINRATFYRHYRDKYDLLEHCMDDALEALRAQSRPTHTETGEQDENAPAINIETMLAHVADNADFYRVMLGKDGAGAFVSRLRDYLHQISADRWESVAGNTTRPLIPPDMTLSFITSAYIGVIVWWVEHNCPGSPAEVADQLLTLTMQGPYRALGLTP